MSNRCNGFASAGIIMHIFKNLITGSHEVDNRDASCENASGFDE